MSQNYLIKQSDKYRKLASKIGSVGNLQRFCIHDGPGLRTVVFLKGCPLMCDWCANPEMQQQNQEIFYSVDECLHCQRCVEVCPENVLVHNNEKIEIDRENCTLCGKCFDVCYAEALTSVGENKTALEVIEIVKKDSNLYKQSKGGITISGGEPTSQFEFTQALLKLAKIDNIHTAIETCGYIEWEKLYSLKDDVDLFLYDIKHMDENIHKKMTGKRNKLILNNFKKLAKSTNNLIARIPVIPEFNYNKKDIQNIMDFITKNKIKEVHFLLYHELGLKKYKKLNRDYLIKKGAKVDEEKVKGWVTKYEGEIKIKFGG